ncbi:MAG: winged helix-turn-helix transcriptional regulator, partial [Thermoplasmata archaeon]
QQIFVEAKVNDSAPTGMNLTNFVVVEYTDANGNSRDGKQAQANISVVQPKMSFQMRLPSTETTPRDVVTVEMRFQNKMTGPSMFAWINLTIPEHLSYLSDTSSTEGGVMTETGRWMFTDVSVGNHSFDVVLLVDNRSQDGLLLTLAASMVYTDQFGTVSETLSDIHYITVYRPEIDFIITPESVTVKLGEAFEVSVYFNNTGSRASESVWINATLPPGVRIVNDTSFEQGGTRVGANFTFENVDTGSHSYQMVIIIENGSGYVNLSFEFGYLDSDGDFLSSGTVRISAQLHKDERFEFPMILLIGIVTVASAALACGLWREESFRLRFLALFIPLYSRLRRKEVLDNEIRGMIRGYVTANPGDHFAAMREALRLKNGTLAYHLTVLEKEKIVKSIRDGKFRRFFPSEMKISETSFPSKIEEMILEIVRGTPGITLKDIASLLGVSSPTASYHIRKLKEMNLIRTERKGISVRHHLQGGP